MSDNIVRCNIFLIRNKNMNVNFNSNDEYVMVFQPVLVRRCDIHSLPPMTSIPQQPPPTPVPQLQAPEAQEQPEQPKTLSKPANAPGSPHTPQKPLKGLASDKQMKCMLTMAREHGISDVELCQYVGAESLEQITKAQASKFIQKFI